MTEYESLRRIGSVLRSLSIALPIGAVFAVLLTAIWGRPGIFSATADLWPGMFWACLGSLICLVASEGVSLSVKVAVDTERAANYLSEISELLETGES